MTASPYVPTLLQTSADVPNAPVLLPGCLLPTVMGNDAASLTCLLGKSSWFLRMKVYDF